MKRSLCPLFLAIGILGFGISIYHLAPFQNDTFVATSSASTRLTPCFTPQNNCKAFVIRTIDSAQDSILVQSYSFTSPEIAHALILAKKRGVDVRLIIDRSQVKAKYSQLKNIKEGGIPFVIDTVSGISHNKIMICDGKKVLTGSFNWTEGA